MDFSLEGGRLYLKLQRIEKIDFPETVADRILKIKVPQFVHDMSMVETLDSSQI